MNPQGEDWLDMDQPKALAAKLRELRRDARLSGTRLAEELGWHQSKVSRFENGTRVPSESDVRAWLRRTGGSDELADQLVGLLGQVRATHTLWTKRLKADQANHQLDFDQLGQSANTIHNVETAVIPGLLQTADYARWKFLENITAYGLEDQDVDRAIAARMQRQSILYDSRKRFGFVITETPLRLFPCPPDVMIGQLDRLLAVLGMGSIDLRIIADGQQNVLPQHGFVLFDDRAIVETHTSEVVLRGEESSGLHRIYGLLAGEAVGGEDARRIIVGALDRLR